jgi:hypothetical protein
VVVVHYSVKQKLPKYTPHLGSLQAGQVASLGPSQVTRWKYKNRVIGTGKKNFLNWGNKLEQGYFSLADHQQ